MGPEQSSIELDRVAAKEDNRTHRQQVREMTDEDRGRPSRVSSHPPAKGLGIHLLTPRDGTAGTRFPGKLADLLHGPRGGESTSDGALSRSRDPRERNEAAGESGHLNLDENRPPGRKR